MRLKVRLSESKLEEEKQKFEEKKGKFEEDTLELADMCDQRADQIRQLRHEHEVEVAELRGQITALKEALPAASMGPPAPKSPARKRAR